MPRTKSQLRPFMMREPLATLCTVGPRHAPHAVPVWFTYKAGRAFVQTDRKSVKVRNIQRDPRVCFTVYKEDEAVVLFGTAAVVPEAEFNTRTAEHIRKYGLRLDKQGRDSLGIPLFDHRVRCVIKITPDRVLYW